MQKLTAARARATLNALETGNVSHLNLSAGIANSNEAKGSESLFIEQMQEQRNKLLALDAQIAQRQAELATTEQTIKKLEQALPMTKEKAENLKELLRDQLVPKHQWLDQEQLRIEQEQDLAVQRKRVAELQAAIITAKQQRASTLGEFRRQASETLVDAEQKLTNLQQESAKAGVQLRYTKLTAPIDGVVQQLAVHTIGAVATSAQPLLVVVPNEAYLEIEALISNQDIGFVNVGQVAAVKVDAFPFTRYGTLPGEITTLSAEAVQDKDRGLVFPATIRLKKSTLKVENKMVTLTPGMAVSVEIKTGKRRVIDYFLSPLLQHVDESLEER